MGLVKQSLRNILQRSGLHRVCSPCNQGPAALFYHGVEEEIADPRVQLVQMPLARFEKEIRYLKRRFEIISLGDLFQGILSGSGLNRRQLVLTFDDGYENLVRNVAPLLKSLKLPFAVFISTGQVDEGLRFPSYYLRACLFHGGLESLKVPSLGQEFKLQSEQDILKALRVIRVAMETSPHNQVMAVVKDLQDALPPERWQELDEFFSSERPLSWAQVEELSQAGAVIGSHGHDHTLLHQWQPSSEIQRQLSLSQRLITEKVGMCSFISYPRGTVSDLCTHT
ncbi:MAG: polysaccharide deacetylase family protein, partial [Desulfarculaceae bacterium]